MRYSLVYFARPEEDVLLKRLAAVMLFRGWRKGRWRRRLVARSGLVAGRWAGWWVGFGKGDWENTKGTDGNASAREVGI